MNPLRQARRYGLKARELYVRHFPPEVTGQVDRSAFRRILESYDAETVFVHVGLSNVNAAFGGRSYDLLYEELTRAFENVLVPGFTPAFRRSGVYHREFSRPEVGMFPILFMDDADYRTEDPIHSIQVAGDYRFEDCDHRNTFAPEGCWGKLDRDNVLVANVGTNRLVSTQFHYVSYNADTPYQEAESHSGVVYHDETDYERVEQVNDTFDGVYNWSRWKMERDLASKGVLHRRDRNGLKLSFFRAGDMRRAIEPEIEADPYYMVT